MRAICAVSYHFFYLFFPNNTMLEWWIYKGLFFLFFFFKKIYYLCGRRLWKWVVYTWYSVPFTESSDSLKELDFQVMRATYACWCWIMTSSSSSHKCDLFCSSILTLDSLYFLLDPSDGNLSVSGSWMSPKGIGDPTRVGSFSPVQINGLDSLQRNGCVDGMASPSELIVGFLSGAYI